MGIGIIVKQRRKIRGWTQTDLAREAGIITQAMVSRIEKGEDNVTVETLRGLARALGCTVVDLLPEEDRRQQSHAA